MRKMIQLLALMAIVGFSGSVTAQDERFMRQLFSGDLAKKREDFFNKTYHFEVFSKPIVMDLDNDNLPEYLVYERKDGENYFTILDPNKKVIKRFWLEAIGKKPTLYRISVRNLGAGIKVFLLSFYEGDVDYLKYESVARLHMVTIKNGDYKTLHHQKGPPIWHEAEDGQRHYHQRQFPYALRDFNGDGIREVVVRSGQASWVYIYRGHAEGWVKI